MSPALISMLGAPNAAAPDHVAQLADVAGPGLIPQAIPSRCDSLFAAVSIGAHLLPKATARVTQFLPSQSGRIGNVRLAGAGEPLLVEELGDALLGRSGDPYIALGNFRRLRNSRG
jgi:hypothetical protein